MGTGPPPPILGGARDGRLRENLRATTARIDGGGILRDSLSMRLTSRSLASFNSLVAIATLPESQHQSSKRCERSASRSRRARSRREAATVATSAWPSSHRHAARPSALAGAAGPRYTARDLKALRQRFASMGGRSIPFVAQEESYDGRIGFRVRGGQCRRHARLQRAVARCR